MFGQTVTTSSDVLRQFNARGRASPRKWLILDGDSNGAGIVPYNYRRNRCRSFSPIQPRRGTNIVAEVQSPKTRSQRCCETMIFVLSSFIRLSEPISRGTVTGQRNSMTRLRGSCPTSRHPNTQARGDVMFGCSDVYHWMGFGTYLSTVNRLRPRHLAAAAVDTRTYHGSHVTRSTHRLGLLLSSTSWF
jgi:hypothetical protein